jgi:hypothetical protein
MRDSSGTLSRAHHIICPSCEWREHAFVGPDFARWDSCGLPLVGSMLETLREIVGLPDALGAHPCECAHPEMRMLSDRVFHCPACGSEVLPSEALLSIGKGHCPESGLRKRPTGVERVPIGRFLTPRKRGPEDFGYFPTSFSTHSGEWGPFVASLRHPPRVCPV